MHTYTDTSGRSIKVLHLEPTDVCQAACPLCARETDPEFDSSKKHHLTIDMLRALFSDDDIFALEKVFMCGNYGDPAAGKHTQDILRWVRTMNPGLVLGMHSNGGIQNTFWWYELAKILNQSQDYVVFSIDGLADTNSFYRVNVNWDTVMANVEAYISAGGVAHWDMLIYRHNQHQVKDCENFAKKLGFKHFRAKVSKRMPTGTIMLPLGWPIQDHALSMNIECHALKEQSVYVDAHGRMHACCWLGSKQENFDSNFDIVRQSWQSNDVHPVCHANCGIVDNDQTAFENQWRYQASW